MSEQEMKYFDFPNGHIVLCHVCFSIVKKNCHGGDSA